MPGNRVEALEEQVAELEATVQGLTEELVEANDRIRQIEAALGADADVALEEADVDPAGVDLDAPDAEPASTDEEAAAPDGETAGGDDIVTAGETDEETAEEPRAELATEEDAAAEAARSVTPDQPEGLRQEVMGEDTTHPAVDGTGHEEVAATTADAEADTDKSEDDEGSDDIIVA